MAGGPSLHGLAWSEEGFGWCWVRPTSGVCGNEVAWVVGTWGGATYVATLLHVQAQPGSLPCLLSQAAPPQ